MIVGEESTQRPCSLVRAVFLRNLLRLLCQPAPEVRFFCQATAKGMINWPGPSGTGSPGHGHPLAFAADAEWLTPRPDPEGRASRHPLSLSTASRPTHLSREGLRGRAAR